MAPDGDDCRMTRSFDRTDVDRTSPVPLYHQVVSLVEDAIRRGDLRPGTRLENEVELAGRLGISRPTLRAAIGQLVDRGMLIRRRGFGTVVTPVQVSRPIGVTSLYDDLMNDGRVPTTEVLALKKLAPTEEVAEVLGLDDGEDVYYLERLRRADQEPIALLRNHIPARLVHLERETLEGTGLYRMMRAAGVKLSLASIVIGARVAEPREAQLFDVPQKSAVVTQRRIAYDDQGIAVEFGLHVYPADRYTFETNMVAR